MSRRRGEFEHRTSIFEGAFRAWSYLGGLDPTDLETKTLAELDPLTPEAEERSRQDPRLKSSDFSQLESPSPPPEGGGAGGSGKNGTKRRIYPYEPLPRSGLAHPFVQAILSPWLGSEAEQNAIQLGLTTLRTWWQHRRKGESGSAISALGTDKMRGVVEGYTRHFFSLAYCLVTNDGEQPPRTLHTKMKDLEKARAKKYKKRAREEEAGKLAALALNAGLAHGLNVSGAAAAAAGATGGGGSSSGVTPSLSDLQQQNAGQLGGASGGGTAGADGVDDSHLSPLERLALAHQRQQQQTQIAQGQNVGGPPIKTPQSGVINLKGKCVPGKLDLQQLALQMSAQGTQVMHAGGLTSGSGGGGKGGAMVQPDHLNSASNMALAGAGAAAHAAQYGGVPNANPNAPGSFGGGGGGGDDEDSGTTPVVLVSPKGDIQIAMSVDGITCAHCVKIVETVLRGCNGNKSPINGLLDAAADHDLCAVIIKIDKSSNAKRVAREAARNLAMVGYTGKVKEMSIADMGTGAGGACCGTNGGSGGAGGGKFDFQTLNAAFDVVAAQDPVDVFDWTIPCTCPDNGVVRQDCKRHAQINQRILQAFDQRAARVTEFVVGCGKKYGRECTCGPNCRCKDGEGCCAKQQGAVGATAAVTQRQNQHQSHNHPIQAQGPGQGVSHSVPQHAALHSQMELSQAQIAEHLTATAAAAAGGRGRSSRNNSMLSRGRRASGHSETFGRAMSGLSQLSIDWENMEDFDVDVDHSAHIDNSYQPGGGASQIHGRPVGGIIEESAEGGMNMEDRTDGIMAGCGMMNGGDCTCGPTCFCVGCPIHDNEKSEPIAGGANNFGAHGNFFGHGGAFQGTFGPGGDAIRRRSSLRKRGQNTSDAAQMNMQVSFKM